MTGVLIVVTAALVLWACCMVVALRNRLRESEQIRDALVTAVHECRAEIARLRITDAEREAIVWAINVTSRTYDDADGGPLKREALRGLTQRLGGRE